MNPDTYTDEQDCAPLTPAQLAARDEAWPEYGSNPLRSRDQARNMAEGRFFHGELETPVPACLGEARLTFWTTRILEESADSFNTHAVLRTRAVIAEIWEAAQGNALAGELEMPAPPLCLGESVKIRFDLPDWPVQRERCSCGSLAGDIRAKLAVARTTATASRYGLHLCAPDALAQFMAECRAFLAQLGEKNEL